MEGSNFSIRVAAAEALPGILPLCAALWPDEPVEAVEPHTAATLSGVTWRTLPLVLFVAEVGLGYEVAVRAIHFRKRLL